MVILGLLLLAIAIIVAVAAIIRGGQTANIDLHWFTIKTDLAVVFIAGLVCLLVAVIGIWLITKGLQRSRHRKAEMNALRDRAERNERTQPAPAAGPTGSESAAPAEPTPSPSGTAGPDRRDPGDDHFDTAPRDERT
ncbi:MAG: hypothetical protein ACR2KG_10960 [Nocardioidaceae bacterium]